MSGIFDEGFINEAEERWREKNEKANGSANDNANETEFRASPHDSDQRFAEDVIDAGLDDWNVPPRQRLLASTFCVEFVSSLLADGGVGKTSLRYAEYLALATGRAITGEHVFRRCRVLIVSFEDSLNELRRRIKAACLHHGIAQKELTGWLFYIALGAKSGKLMMLDARGNTVTGSLASNIEKFVIDMDFMSSSLVVLTDQLRSAGVALFARLQIHRPDADEPEETSLREVLRNAIRVRRLDDGSHITAHKHHPLMAEDLPEIAERLKGHGVNARHE